MPDDVPITEIVASCLDDFERRGDEALREHCARHPEIETVLRRAVEAVNKLRGVSRVTSADADGLFAERYRIGRRIGVGGMGAVYRAVDTKLDREVALKQVRLEFAGVEEVRQRFDREVRAATRVEHPNLCRVYDGGVWEEIPFMVMELIEGETLHHRIHDRGTERGDPDERLSYVERIADALHAVHEAGMLHRDVKPANIMIGPDDNPVLLDFGLARDVRSPEALTRAGFEPGTWSYMSPEQISPGHSTLDRRTDVYSLGLVLYECVTGTRAFDGGSEHELKTRILKEMPAPIRRTNPRVSKELAVVVEKAIAKNRDDRYPTTAALAEDLRRIRRREPISARRFGPALRTWRWSQRNPMLAAFLVVLVAGVATSTALFLEATKNLGLFKQQEQATREEMARSAFVLARRHAQRGDWHRALEEYARAEDAGYEDPTEIAIGRIVAWESSDRLAEATAELSRLGTGEDLGPHRAKILLLDADIDTNRLLRPDDKVEQIELARSLGLSPADDLYAQALLAPTVDASIEFLQRALAIEPSHRRAIELLGNLGLVSGRRSLARKVLHMRRALYPDDPTNIPFEAFLISMEGGDLDTDELLAGASPRVREMMETWIPFMADTSELIRTFDRLQVEALVDPKSNFFTVFGRMRGFVMTAMKMLNEKRMAKGGMKFRLTPTVAKSAVGIIRAVGASLLRLDTRHFAGALLDAGRTLGDGMFSFGAGTVYLNAKQLDDAERAFRDAHERGSSIVSRRTVELFLLEIQWRRFRDAAGPERKARVTEAVSLISSILEHDDLDRRVLRYLFLIAENLGANAAGLEVALRWKRQFPEDEQAQAALSKALGWIRPGRQNGR